MGNTTTCGQYTTKVDDKCVGNPPVKKCPPPVKCPECPRCEFFAASTFDIPSNITDGRCRKNRAGECKAGRCSTNGMERAIQICEAHKKEINETIDTTPEMNAHRKSLGIPEERFQCGKVQWKVDNYEGVYTC